MDIVIHTSESNCAYSSLRSASNSPFFLKVWRSESIMDRLVCDMGRSEGFNLLRGGITSANTCSSPSRERLRSTAAMPKRMIQERMCRVICEGDAGVTELATDIWPQGGARILRKAGQRFAKSYQLRQYSRFSLYKLTNCLTTTAENTTKSLSIREATPIFCKY